MSQASRGRIEYCIVNKGWDCIRDGKLSCDLGNNFSSFPWLALKRELENKEKTMKAYSLKMREPSDSVLVH